MTPPPPPSDILRQRCEELTPHVQSSEEAFEELRKVQNDWEAIDPDSARAYFSDLVEENHDSAMHHYFYGRLVKGRVEAVSHARSAIELAPDWVYGYRLLMNVYSGCLFRGECRRDVQAAMRHELERDAPFFEHVLDVTPDAGNLLGYVFEYHLYRREPKRARAVIKKAKKLKQEWALEHDAVMMAKACAGEHRPLTRYATDLVNYRISRGQLPSEEKDEAIRQYMVYWYRHGHGHQAGLELLEEWLERAEEWQKPAIHYDMARFNALLGRDDAAFDHLEQAVEGGYSDLERFECQSCLSLLREDSRWRKFHEKIQENWLALRQERREKALAMEVDEPLPDITLPDEKGTPVRLHDRRGRVLVLEFWATYCRPCRKGMPELSDFSRLDAEEGEVEVYMVNVANENREMAREFVDRRRYKAHLLFGDEATKRTFGVEAIPTLLVVSPSGRIRFRERGAHYGLRERLNWWVQWLKQEQEKRESGSAAPS